MKRARWLAIMVAASSLGITAGLWRHERRTEEANLRIGFDFGVRQAASRVEQRMASYEQTLRGVQGLFMASQRIDDAGFAAYVDALLVGHSFDGLGSISYSVAKGDADGRLTAQVILCAPSSSQDSGQRGDDPYADPIRQAAMQQARDSGHVAITTRLRLETDPSDAPPGSFLMFLPVYVRGEAVESLAARRSHLAGWVGAAFSARNLMATLYGETTPGLDVSIYDGVDLADRALMYRVGAAPADPRFEAEEYVGFAGHTWTVRVRSLPEFEQRHSLGASGTILAAGAGLSLLLALLTWQLATGRARAYDVAQAMTRELRAGEERYRRIVETANEGIWMADGGGRIVFVNPKMLQLLGLAERDMLGRPIAEFSEAVVPALIGIASDRPAQETTWRRRDGSTMSALLSVSAIADPNGGPDGILGMLTDVTERRHAEAKRSLLEAQLRESQKMQAIGTLAGGIAHDFNNIVAAILGNVALARQQLESAQPAQTLLAQIDKAGLRARALVQQILAFSRVQPQATVSQPLGPLVQEAIALLRPMLPANVIFETRLAAASIHASVDATQIQQVMMNLGTNALHALPDAGGTIVVGLAAAEIGAEQARALGAAEPGSYAHLWVKDNGSGMDEAIRARVFEPFFTTKRTGQGTGLGLSVVHGIVAAHRGAIAVESAPGRGSTFHLYFPLCEPQVAEPIPEPVMVETPRANGQHVLYVDDDPTMLLMVEALLLRAGYHVTCVEGPSEALAAVQTAADAYDVIVTDFNMPEYSGLELAIKLARLRPGLPVVITSGYITEEMRSAALHAGVRALLQKEYTVEQLATVLHEALRA